METQLSSSSSSPSCWYCYGKCWWRKSQMKMKRGKQTHTQVNNATLQPKQLMLCCLLCMLIAVLCCQCLSVICISAYQLHLIFFRQGTLLFIITFNVAIFITILPLILTFLMISFIILILALYHFHYLYFVNFLQYKPPSATNCEIEMNKMMIWLISRFNWYCNNVVWWLSMGGSKAWKVQIMMNKNTVIGWMSWVENAELNAKLKLWNWREEPYWLVISETAKQIEKNSELFNELMEMWECKLYSYKTISQSIFLFEANHLI